MTKWLKLDELPEDFWGECFIGWWLSNGNCGVDPYVVQIRNFGTDVKWYCESFREWFDFRDDVEYRVMPVQYPTIDYGDFKNP